MRKNGKHIEIESRMLNKDRMLLPNIGITRNIFRPPATTAADFVVVVSFYIFFFW